MSKVVSILNYGVGNIFSVSRAVEQCGAIAKLIGDPSSLRNAEHLILPGVGAFGNAMGSLTDGGFIEPIHKHVSDGKPLLGICLGMQLLFTTSQELGEYHGLGLIEGSVERIPSTRPGEKKRKVPHIGWSEVHYATSSSGSLYRGLPQRAYFYFIHSFHAVPKDPGVTSTLTKYENLFITASVERNNVFGCQFHPEKSGELGLSVLKNFIYGVDCPT